MSKSQTSNTKKKEEINSTIVKTFSVFHLLSSYKCLCSEFMPILYWPTGFEQIFKCFYVVFIVTVTKELLQEQKQKQDTAKCHHFIPFQIKIIFCDATMTDLLSITLPPDYIRHSVCCINQEQRLLYLKIRDIFFRTEMFIKTQKNLKSHTTRTILWDTCYTKR